MKKIVIILFLIFTSSFTPIAAKFTVAEISPLSLAFFRFGIAAILFNIIFLSKKYSYKFDNKDLIRFLCLGALVIPINQFFFLNGVKMSFASHSGITYACTPLFAYIILIFLKHEHFSVKKLIPILLTIVGIFFVFYDAITKTKFADSDVLLGDIYLFFAVLSWALYITLSKDMVDKYGALKTTTLSFTIGILMFIPIFIYDFKNFTLDNLSLYGILGFFHLSFFVAFAGYFVFTYSSKYIKVTELTTTTNVSPIVTIIFSWILLKEELSYFFIVGALITILGVFLSQVKYDEKSIEIIK